jgi:hypothetical protein
LGYLFPPIQYQGFAGPARYINDNLPPFPPTPDGGAWLQAFENVTQTVLNQGTIGGSTPPQDVYMHWGILPADMNFFANLISNKIGWQMSVPLPTSIDNLYLAACIPSYTSGVSKLQSDFSSYLQSLGSQGNVDDAMGWMDQKLKDPSFPQNYPNLNASELGSFLTEAYSQGSLPVTFINQFSQVAAFCQGLQDTNLGSDLMKEIISNWPNPSDLVSWYNNTLCSGPKDLYILYPTSSTQDVASFCAFIGVNPPQYTVTDASYQSIATAMSKFKAGTEDYTLFSDALNKVHSSNDNPFLVWGNWLEAEMSNGFQDYPHLQPGTAQTLEDSFSFQSIISPILTDYLTHHQDAWKGASTNLNAFVQQIELVMGAYTGTSLSGFQEYLNEHWTVKELCNLCPGVTSDAVKAYFNNLGLQIPSG